MEPGFARVAVHPGFPRHRVSCPRLSDHQGALGAEIGRKRRRAAGLFWREEKCGGGEKGGEQVAVR